jgi:hypothetical protein
MAALTAGVTMPPSSAPPGPVSPPAESSPASGELPLDPPELVEPLLPPEPLPASGDVPPPLLLDVVPPEPLPPVLDPLELEEPELDPPEVPPDGIHVLEELPQAGSRGIVTTASAHRREGRMFTAEENGNLGASATCEEVVLTFLPVTHVRSYESQRGWRGVNIEHSDIEK